MDNYNVWQNTTASAWEHPLRRREYPEEYWSFCTMGRVKSLRADVLPNPSCITHVVMSLWTDHKPV